MTTGVGTQSALLLATPEAEELVHKWREELDPAAGWGIPAHITLLYPFAPPDRITDEMLATVKETVGTSRSFHYSLRDVRWFGDQVVYLAPNPEAPFLSLIHSLVGAFPAYLPYGGRFAEVVPHLTVGNGAAVGRLQEVARALAGQLPIHAVASQVLLMTGATSSNSWTVRERFVFAQSA